MVDMGAVKEPGFGIIVLSCNVQIGNFPLTNIITCLLIRRPGCYLGH